MLRWSRPPRPSLAKLLLKQSADAMVRRIISEDMRGHMPKLTAVQRMVRYMRM